MKGAVTVTVYKTFWKTGVVAPGSQAPGNIINPADIITFWDVLLPRWRELSTAWKCGSIAFDRVKISHDTE